MTFGLSAATIGLIGAGASVATGLIGADAAGNAADAQVQSSREANQLQRDIFNKQVELNDPSRRAGLGAQNRLMTLLGITPGASASGIGGAGAPKATYSKGGPVPTSYVNGQTDDPVWEKILETFNTGHQSVFGKPMNRAWDADADADRAYQDLVAQYHQAKGTAPDDPDEGLGDPNDPEFGSLMRDFSMEDFEADPGYQFRLDEGQRGLDRSAAARGGLLSGRAAKDMTAYSQGMGAQEYGAAYNRFQTNRNNKLNPLQSLMGAAQTGTNQISNAAQNFGTRASDNITGAGNARASGYMGQANAISGGVSGGINAYQNNNLLSKIWGPTGSDSWRTTGNGYDY